METMVLDPEKTGTSSAARILIADDQPDVVEALRLLLKGEGYEAEGVNSPCRGLAGCCDSEISIFCCWT